MHALSVGGHRLLLDRVHQHAAEGVITQCVQNLPISCHRCRETERHGDPSFTADWNKYEYYRYEYAGTGTASHSCRNSEYQNRTAYSIYTMIRRIISVCASLPSAQPWLSINFLGGGRGARAGTRRGVASATQQCTDY